MEIGFLSCKFIPFLGMSCIHGLVERQEEEVVEEDEEGEDQELIEESRERNIDKGEEVVLYTRYKGDIV